MWKWLVIIIAAISIGLFPVTTLAATTQDVTITATPGYGIISFSIDYISDTQMDLSWVASGDVVNVMVRAQYGEDLDEIPDEDTAPSDGYLVYEGGGTSVSDTSMDFDQNTGPLYYKLWGQKGDGKWYTGSLSGFEESAVVTLIALVFLALGLFVCLFIFKRTILGWASMAGWIVTGGYCYTKSVSEWDVYYTIFYLSILLLFITIIELWMMVSRSKGIDPEDKEGFDEVDSAIFSEDQELADERDAYDKVYGSRRRRLKSRRRLSRYEQTDEN